MQRSSFSEVSAAKLVLANLWDESIDGWDAEHASDEYLYANDEEIPVVSRSFLKTELIRLTEQRADLKGQIAHNSLVDHSQGGQARWAGEVGRGGFGRRGISELGCEWERKLEMRIWDEGMG